jgi:hypothetical protein
MIRKFKSGYRLYSGEKNPKTGKRRNLGTFKNQSRRQETRKSGAVF